MLPRQEGVTLHVRAPRDGKCVFTWDELQSDEFPSHAIALDGFVHGEPRINYARPCLNLNHHEDVARFATRATCEQVRVALDMGLYARLFRKDGKPHAHAFVNDRDQDVCLSWYQLSRYPHLDGPLMTRLVAVQGLLDMAAGSYPIHPDAPVLREFAWIFEPYVDARMSGKLASETANEIFAGIEAVCNRIDEYMLGRGKQIALDTRYTVLREGTGWKLVSVKGYYARLKMRQDGITAFVDFRGESNGSFTYSAGCEPFERVSMLELGNDFNANEPDGRTWGGGDTIIGSPRGIGSALNPDRVFEIAENRFKNL